MIEEEMIDEIKQSRGVDEPCLFPKEEWDSLIREEKCKEDEDFPKEKWHQVSNIPDPYEHAPKSVRLYHELYERLWLKHRGR